MTPNNNDTTDSTLARRTLRLTAMLVGACVIFVGGLSVVAVAVTSRAVGGGSGAAATQAGTQDSAPNAKKPLSI